MDVRGWNAVINGHEPAVKIIMKDSSLVYLIKEPDIKGYTPLDLLLESNNHSSLLSWLQSAESAIPYRILFNRRITTYIGFHSQQDFPLDEHKHEEEILEWMKDPGKNPLGRNIVEGAPFERKSWCD